MNIYAYQREVRESNLPWPLKSFLLVLTTWSTGQAWDIYPPTSALVQITGHTKRHISRMISQLRDEGWIEVEMRSNRRTINLKNLNVDLVTSVSSEQGSGDLSIICESVQMTSVSRGDDMDVPPSYIMYKETNKRPCTAERVGAREPEQAQTQEDTNANEFQGIWNELWGRAAIPPQILSASPHEQRHVLAWLLAKRNSPEGVGNYRKISVMVLGDIQNPSHTRVAWEGWTPELLREIKRGMDPRAIMRRAQIKSNALESRRGVVPARVIAQRNRERLTASLLESDGPTATREEIEALFAQWA